jgi:hypothetical protein
LLKWKHISILLLLKSFPNKCRVALHFMHTALIVVILTRIIVAFSFLANLENSLHYQLQASKKKTESPRDFENITDFKLEARFYSMQARGAAESKSDSRSLSEIHVQSRNRKSPSRTLLNYPLGQDIRTIAPGPAPGSTHDLSRSESQPKVQFIGPGLGHPQADHHATGASATVTSADTVTNTRQHETSACALGQRPLVPEHRVDASTSDFDDTVTMEPIGNPAGLGTREKRKGDHLDSTVEDQVDANPGNLGRGARAGQAKSQFDDTDDSDDDEDYVPPVGADTDTDDLHTMSEDEGAGANGDSASDDTNTKGPISDSSRVTVNRPRQGGEVNLSHCRRTQGRRGTTTNFNHGRGRRGTDFGIPTVGRSRPRANAREGSAAGTTSLGRGRAPVRGTASRLRGRQGHRQGRGTTKAGSQALVTYLPHSLQVQAQDNAHVDIATASSQQSAAGINPAAVDLEQFEPEVNLINEDSPADHLASVFNLSEAEPGQGNVEIDAELCSCCNNTWGQFYLAAACSTSSIQHILSCTSESESIVDVPFPDWLQILDMSEVDVDYFRVVLCDWSQLEQIAPGLHQICSHKIQFRQDSTASRECTIALTYGNTGYSRLCFPASTDRHRLDQWAKAIRVQLGNLTGIIFAAPSDRAKVQVGCFTSTAGKLVGAYVLESLAEKLSAYAASKETTAPKLEIAAYGAKEKISCFLRRWQLLSNDIISPAHKLFFDFGSTIRPGTSASEDTIVIDEFSDFIYAIMLPSENLIQALPQGVEVSIFKQFGLTHLGQPVGGLQISVTAEAWQNPQLRILGLLGVQKITVYSLVKGWLFTTGSAQLKRMPRTSGEMGKQAAKLASMIADIGAHFKVPQQCSGLRVEISVALSSNVLDPASPQRNGYLCHLLHFLNLRNLQQILFPGAGVNGALYPIKISVQKWAGVCQAVLDRAKSSFKIPKGYGNTELSPSNKSKKLFAMLATTLGYSHRYLDDWIQSNVNMDDAAHAPGNDSNIPQAAPMPVVGADIDAAEQGHDMMAAMPSVGNEQLTPEELDLEMDSSFSPLQSAILREVMFVVNRGRLAYRTRRGQFSNGFELSCLGKKFAVESIEHHYNELFRDFVSIRPPVNIE